MDSQGREAFNFVDPTGGTFDAAGDFDRLLGQRGVWRVWSRIEEHGETHLGATEAAELLADLDGLQAIAREGPESRGLARLRVMAEDCIADPGAVLVFRGD